MTKKKITKKVVKKEVKKVEKKSPVDLYLALEEELKVAFKKLELTLSDLRKLADKSRVQKEFACSKLVKSSKIDDLLTVVKRSFKYRDDASLKLIGRVSELSDNDLRTLIKKNALAGSASYHLEERKKAKNLKKVNE